MIANLQITLLAMIVYVIFWASNTIASLVLNLAVVGEAWSREKFIKSIWKLFGMLSVVVLLTIGLSMASTETITIATLSDLIYVAAFTRLAEAITKVKDMFGYKEESKDSETEVLPIAVEYDTVYESDAVEPTK